MPSFRSFLTTSKTATAAANKTEVVQAQKERRIIEKPFYVNKLPLFSSLPPETRRWIHDASDERAAIQHGCRFVEARGQYVVDWISSNCILYEGDQAGQYMSVEDWQYDFYMQWGWLWFSKDWAIRTKSEELGWVRRYRKISGWVPKKNTKSPTLAGAGLYTLLADGERGQKCFSVAKDQNQALLSHRHAVEFINQNPELLRFCQINKTTNEIIDHRTKSRYMIKSGSTASNRDRNEGLNGNLFIDETHVVDEKQMSILSRAGISRRQFIHVQLSTAGTNTAGYGYKECVAGRQNLVNAETGLDFDFRFKHIEYSCPQDVSIEDLRNEEKVRGYVKQANPTLGRIVMPDEIMHDWQQSKHTDTKLIEFAMYRLNLWNTAGGAFVAGSDWMKCYHPYSFKSMKPYPCVIGGDFSRRRDMTCLMLMFAVPKTITIPVDPFDPETEYVDKEVNVPHIHPYFFLPEAAVARYEKYMNLNDYASNGLLTITKGATIRAQTIASYIARIDRDFDLKLVGGDSYYTTDIAVLLESEYGWNISGEESRIRLVGQSCSAIGPAIEQLQNCILNEELVHNNHGLLNWQLKNVKVVEDNNGNRRFEKPTADDWRKIDGWSALANGIFCMMSTPELYPGQLFGLQL